MEDKKFTEQDRAFYKDGYQLGNLATSEPGSSLLFETISAMYKGIDDLIDSILQLAKKQNVSIDCKKGCSWCCHQAIFANSYEVHFLGNYIEKNLPKNIRKEILHDAKSKELKTSTLNEAEVLNFKHPCPLLKNGACLAYDARPMACRIYLSQSVKTCIDFYKAPEQEENYPALLEFPLRAGRMMNEGFTAALKENGTLTAEFRLEDGLSRYFSKQKKEA